MENAILQMEKNQKNFMENPSKPGEYIKKVEQILLEFDCHVVSEAFAHRFEPVVSTHTRFQHKTTKKTTYLLDQMMGITPHTRLREDVCEQLILEIAQSSYQKAGESLKGKDVISRESVMCHVHLLNFEEKTREKGKEKRQVKR